MVINRDVEHNAGHVGFVSYTGQYPNLCRGILTLNIDGKEVRFGDFFKDTTWPTFPRFWTSGGRCGFKDGNYQNPYTAIGEWLIDYTKIPMQYRAYADEINTVFNNNVEFGCCGGCL
jgi:hypothetical protein